MPLPKVAAECVVYKMGLEWLPRLRDGEYLYVLGETDVAIVDVGDAGAMRVTSRVDVPGSPFAELLRRCAKMP